MGDWGGLSSYNATLRDDRLLVRRYLAILAPHLLHSLDHVHAIDNLAKDDVLATVWSAPIRLDRLTRAIRISPQW